MSNVILKITKEMLDAENNYIGEQSVSDFDGSIEISAALGYVRFGSVKVSGFIIALAGSGIKAGWGIEAGSGIESGEGF